MIPRVLSGKWLTNVLLTVLSAICFWGFNHLEKAWDKFTTQTDINTGNIADMRKDVDANSRMNMNQQVDLDLLKKKSYETDADLKFLHNERATVQAKQPDTSFLQKATSLWANTHRNGDSRKGQHRFPLAFFPAYIRQLPAIVGYHHSGYLPDGL